MLTCQLAFKDPFIILLREIVTLLMCFSKSEARERTKQIIEAKEH